MIINSYVYVVFWWVGGWIVLLGWIVKRLKVPHLLVIPIGGFVELWITATNQYMTIVTRGQHTPSHGPLTPQSLLNVLLHQTNTLLNFRINRFIIRAPWKLSTILRTITPSHIHCFGNHYSVLGVVRVRFWAAEEAINLFWCHYTFPFTRHGLIHSFLIDLTNWQQIIECRESWLGLQIRLWWKQSHVIWEFVRLRSKRNLTNINVVSIDLNILKNRCIIEIIKFTEVRIRFLNF